MNIAVDSTGAIQLKEVYVPINLKSSDGELFSICMRDAGFEFEYQGTKYSAQDGKVDKVVQKRADGVEKDNPMLQ